MTSHTLAFDCETTTHTQFGAPMGMYGDARVIAPFNPNDAHYQTPCSIMVGKDAKSEDWRPLSAIANVGALFAFLAKHPESKSKDGLAFVFAAMVPGPRAKAAVTAMHAFVFDFDFGTAPDTIDAAFRKSGKAFARYTSFSNCKTLSDFSRDAVCKYLKCSKAEIDSAAMQRYTRECLHWVEEVSSTVELVEIKQNTKGFRCFISHAPLHKNRVVVPLDAPFVIDDYENGQEATAKWKEIYFGFTESIGLLDHIDRTGADLNRLFYPPRHPKGGAYDAVIAGGPLLDWKSLDFSNAWADEAGRIGGDKSSRTKTPEGQAQTGWWHEYSHRSQLASLIESETDKMRGSASRGIAIECPFDSEHGNAGDAEDVACFAVDADGDKTTFVRCQHNSCRDYTTLDHVGKMLAEGWFTEEVLEGDSYNALAEGESKSSPADKAAVVEEAGDQPSNAASSQIVVSDGYGGALAFQKYRGRYPKGVTHDKESRLVHATFRNALLLIGSEHWGLSYSELTQNYGVRGEANYPWPEHMGYVLNDAIRREIRLYLLRRYGITFKLEDVYEATMTLARRNAFNPVCEYLADVEPKWDGVPRVERWLETYLGVVLKDDDFKMGHAAYVRAIAKLVLVAAVRRAREPGCKFDELLLLEGPQGGGKSTAIKILGGEWYSDAKLGDLTNTQKVGMKLRGTWLHEFGELIGLTKAEVEEVKDFLSKCADRFKQPYGRSEDDYARRCIFIGSINPGGGAYLTDLTGNRRMWPVACGTIDLEALARDRDMLWAEAAMMESRGDSFRLHSDLYGAAAAEQASRLADDPWREILADHLDEVLPTKEGKLRVTSNALLTIALEIPKDRLTQAHMKRLKAVMATVPNWKYKECLRTAGERTAGYEYEKPSASENGTEDRQSE